MKCPKCGYLGFEEAERCRNCGHDFALTTTRFTLDLNLRGPDREVHDVDDLDLVDAAAHQSVATAPPQTEPVVRHAVPMRGSGLPSTADEVGELPLFSDDVPLITKTSPPRAPLSVRRATPEVPRLRTEVLPRTPPLEFHDSELEMPLEATVSPAIRASAPEWTAPVSSDRAAGLAARFFATLIDLVLLGLVDLAVIYFTVQICGLTANELYLLPLGPLIVFLVVQNGGYLVAFTVGGQTIGKMLTGIRVVAAEPGASLDLGRSLLRTAMWSVMALPAGLGLLTALFNDERRAFHDRFAGTKVIRAIAA